MSTIGKGSLAKIFTLSITIPVLFCVLIVGQVYPAKYPWTAPLSGQNEVPSVESDVLCGILLSHFISVSYIALTLLVFLGGTLM